VPFNYETPPEDGNRSWGNWLRGVLAAVKSFVDWLETQLDTKAPTSHTHTRAQVSDASTLGRSIMGASSASSARTLIAALGSPNSSITGIAYYSSEAALPGTGTAGVVYVIPST